MLPEKKCEVFQSKLIPVVMIFISIELVKFIRQITDVEKYIQL